MSKPTVTADLDGFERQFSAILVSVVEEGDRVLRKVALAALTTIAMETPVDTGRARANWNVALDEPDRTLREAPGSAGQAAGDAIARGSQVIAQAKMGTTIILSNSLPYAPRLNDGWSAQAPAGFVEKGLQVAVTAVRGEKVTL